MVLESPSYANRLMLLFSKLRTYRSLEAFVLISSIFHQCELRISLIESAVLICCSGILTIHHRTDDVCCFTCFVSTGG